MQAIMHEFIMICNEMCIFQNINITFAKHWKIKRIYLQKKMHLVKKTLKFYWPKKTFSAFNGENAGPSKK